MMSSCCFPSSSVATSSSIHLLIFCLAPEKRIIGVYLYENEKEKNETFVVNFWPAEEEWQLPSSLYYFLLSPCLFSSALRLENWFNKGKATTWNSPEEVDIFSSIFPGKFFTIVCLKNYRWCQKKISEFSLLYKLIIDRWYFLKIDTHLIKMGFTL